MPSFSQASLKQLETCHQDLQVLFKEVIKYFDCAVTEGFRDEAAQNKAFDQGNSKLRWPNGNHNYFPSRAADVYPYPINLSVKNAKDAELYRMRMCYFAGQVMAIARKLRDEGKMTHSLAWGGDFNENTVIGDQSFTDMPHFQLQIK